MSVVAWVLIIASFIIAFVGLVYPIIPSVLFIFLGFVFYGLFFSFGDLPLWFWIVQIIMTVLLFAADTAANYVGVKKFGGTNAGIWGSTIGLIVGPILLSFIGIIVGPFVGAVVGELIFSKKTMKEALLAGVGSLVGFFTSIASKGILQAIMIGLFVFVV